MPTGEIWINVTKEIYPTIIHPCEPATIAINVTAEGGPIIESIPVSVIFVIDLSTSMNWEYENETGDLHPGLYYVKNAANAFIDQMDLTNDTVGVVSFKKLATLNKELTHNGNDAKNVINGLIAGGAGNMGEGIRIAQQELTVNCSPDAQPVILLFSDGIPTAHSPGGDYCWDNCPTSNNTCSDYARNQANSSKDNNTKIFSMGYTDTILSYESDCYQEPYDANATVAFAKWLLKDIASGEDYYYEAPNAADIEEIYLNISQTVSNVVASNLVVSDYLPSHFIITDDGGGDYSVLPNGTHKIEFNRSSLALNDSWNINFEITTLELGDLLLTNFNNSNLTYIRDGISNISYLPYPKYINVTSPLGIEKNAPTQVNRGDQFIYSIYITNIGHMALDNVTITDPLSDKVAFNSIESNYSGFNTDNWDYSDHILNIADIVLDVGEKIKFNISVTVSDTASGNIENPVYSGYSTSAGCTVRDISNTSVTTSIYVPPPPPPPPPPSDITADANGPYYEFLIRVDGYAEVKFDGSDSKGDIHTYSWDFGDGNTSAEQNPINRYAALGNYTVILIVKGPVGEASDQTYAVISEEPNHPPEQPDVSGPQTGSADTDYEYTAFSTDKDNDAIQYIFDWDDGTNTTTDFVPNGTLVNASHNWSTWGIYTVSVIVYDNQSAPSDTKDYVVLINVLLIDNGIKGYLVDENSNGTYDSFKNTDTGNQTAVKQENSYYLIDSDGDSKWDHVYNLETGVLTYYKYVYLKYFQIFQEEKATPGFELISVLTMIALLFIIMKRRRKNS